jgi:hypothetical protein
MSENIVALHGTYRAAEPDVDERLVEELNRLLEAAKAGEIIGMAGTYLHKDRGASYSFAGVVGTYSMVGGLECAKERVLRIATRQD